MDKTTQKFALPNSCITCFHFAAEEAQSLEDLGIFILTKANTLHTQSSRRSTALSNKKRLEEPKQARRT
jgi:hypothetical protein